MGFSGYTSNVYKDVTESRNILKTDHGCVLMVDSSLSLITLTLTDAINAGFWCQIRLVDETNGAAISAFTGTVLNSENDATTLVTKNHVAILEHRGDGIWYATGLE